MAIGVKNVKFTETMKDVPFASSEDNYGSKCNKFGEPWLKNNWESHTCENILEHRQVGAASAYNQGLASCDPSFNKLGSSK